MENDVMVHGLLMVAAPIAVYVAKMVSYRLEKSLPSVSLPMLSMIFGALGAWVCTVLGVDIGLMEGAVLGLAGVGVREGVDQFKKYIASEDH